MRHISYVPSRTIVRHSPITIVLIVLNIAIFIAELITGNLSQVFLGTTDSTLVSLYGLYPPAVQGGEWWRLFTSMFLHSGIMHIFFNMLTLYSIGWIIEREFGWFRYLLIYLLSGLCGGLFTCFIELARTGAHLTVGASGAIFGLFGALLGLGLRTKNWSYARSTLINIIWMLLPGFFSAGVSITSHIGGVLGGIVLGLSMSKKGKNYTHG